MRLGLARRVVVIGAGGVGSCLLEPLAIFLSACDTNDSLLIVDGDEFNPSNAYRVCIPDMCNKAYAWAEKIRGLFPNIVPDSAGQYVTDKNIGSIIPNGSTVFLCVDNHATRKLVSEHCENLANVLLISGGNDGVNDYEDGTCGTVQVFHRKNGETVCGSPLGKYHPDIQNPADKNPADMDCNELVAGGEPQILFANMMVASLMLNAFARILMKKSKGTCYDEVAFDLYENSAQPIWISRPKPG
jgi:hypothetical protein